LDPWDQFQVELPQVGGESALAEIHWHVILPKNYRIVHDPSSLAQAYFWTWSLSGVEPKPLPSSVGIRDIGGRGELLRPAAGEVEYLYSGFGPQPSLEATVARRELLYFAAAALVLAGGLGLLYVPALRRASVLFVAAIVLLCAGIIFPEMLLICGPALAVGAALALLACLLFVLVPQRIRAEPTSRASTVHGTYMSSRDNYLVTPMAAASSNAPTVALRTSESNA
jgi:hypothetical protein